MNIEEYKLALKKGEKVYSSCVSKKQNPYLPVLDDITANVKIVNRQNLGLVTIPTELIVGTVNANRSNAFTRDFLPLLDADTEFAIKWGVLYDSMIEEGMRDPVIAFEYMNRFYIREGNKRVSVSKYMDTVEIEGMVTRLVPAKDDTPEVSLYYEFLDFYEKSEINYIYFSKPGLFAKFAKQVAGDSEVWSEDTRMDVRSLYTKFKKEYLAKGGDKLPLPVGEALLSYVTLLGFEDVKNKTNNEIKADLAKIWSEFKLDAQPEPVALSTHPTSAKPVMLNVLKAIKKLKIAFVHLGNIENSAWVYAHELGRQYVENQAFKDEIETEVYFNVSIEECEDTLEEICHKGYDMIFVTSPQHNAACAKVAILHPEVKILNCSLNASTKHLRTYYLRTYESKYLLGIIAGAMTKTNKIAYIADYPVYGSVASINAFAVGAKTVNPDAEIYLSWTSVKLSDPDQDIEESGCDIVSNLDWSSPKHLTRKFGLYLNGEPPVNLAAPLWDWGKLYESIIKSVKRGSWKIEEASIGTQSLGYWWGLSSGAVDIIYSGKVPALTLQLVGFLKTQISKSNFRPFYGRLEFQNGETADVGEGMDYNKLIAMDKLYENVHGFIPGVNDVKDETVELTKVQGVFSEDTRK
ncbi:MAG: BMP family ABC transporter substrate-binding protein [Lachnospiraceae bacterium]